MLLSKRSFSFRIILLVACFAAGNAFAAGSVCDPKVKAQVSEQVDKYREAQTQYERATATPSPPLAQMANQPCLSKELGRISDQFSYAPTRYAQDLTGQIKGAAGPAAGIMEKMFKSEFESINKAAQSMQGMLNFQSMASEVMGSLLESIGLGDAFSSELCGLMVDMLMKYVQCENPIKLPELGDIFGGSLDDLIPNNCAGNALRSGLYEAGNMKSLESLNQKVTAPPGGTFTTTAPRSNRPMPGAFN